MRNPIIWLLYFVLLIKISNSQYAQFETNSRLEIDINNRGYVNLVVAIGGGVEENHNLIEALESVLIDFSRYLHNLTGFYLHNVRILVPESWLPDPNLYEPVTWETFENSDIRIDHIEDGDEDDAFAHAPYTNKPSQCGLPGRYIHLTPKFILDPTIATHYGEHEKVLAREWAKYRWGVFGESPDSTGAHFYASSTGDIEGTRCSKERQGTWQTTTGQKCDPRLQGTDDCLFVDLEATGSNEASIMYRQYLTGVDQFCQEGGRTNNPSIVHNIEAPNQQNRHCDRKSVMQVLREHPDFRTVRGRVTWSAPIFDIIRRSQGKVVLVLDRSTSMNEFNRLAILRQAAYNFITRVIPDGQRLGIVQFNDGSGDADVKSPLREINDQTRQDLLISVPDNVNGKTSIGAGVRNGLKVLEEGPNGKAAGGRMILITDGEETEQPNIDRILTEDYKKLSTITIHTIAVGPEADNKLEDLANFTNGRHFHHVDSSTTLFDVFSQFGFEDTVRTSSEIFSSSFILLPNKNNMQIVNVDTSIEGDVLFLIGADDIESLLVEVRQPDGSMITFADRMMYKRIDDFDLIKITTRNVMYGTWTILTSNLDTQVKNVSVVVEGGVSRTTPIITVEARWAVGEMTPPNEQTLFVTVSRGYVPVGGATVNVTISHDDGEVETRLWDDGVGADVMANDGIYSRYITTFDGPGRYGAKVVVSGTPRITKILVGRRLGSTAPSNIVSQSRGGNIDEETGAFQRVADAGSFKCLSNITCGEMLIPLLYGPAKVTDLRVENIDLKKMSVDLVFTAPGGDLMDGQATSYIIRWARSFNELHENFHANPEIERRAVPNAVYYSTTSANISPQMAREREAFTVILPELGDFSYVFALTATDQYGVVSPISNFASVSAKHPPALLEPVTQPMASQAPDTMPDTMATTLLPSVGTALNTSSENDTFPWYFILIALLALILFLIFLLLFVWRRKTTKETDESTILPPASPRSPVENAFNNPGSHSTVSSSVRYSRSPVGDTNDYSSVIANPEYEYADVSSASAGIKNSHSPSYEYASGVPATQAYAVTSAKIASPPTSYAFASGIPSPAYGVSSSKLRRNPSQDRGEKNNVGFGSSVHGDDVNSAYEFVRRGPHDGRSNQYLRHSAIISKSYKPQDETGVKRASIAGTNWKEAGGSNYNLFGVQPQKDETKKASIKSRGQKASKGKLPPL
ncbi:Calcium-activated chloride channel regulator 2 [Holothuria leucospilota]|uniref:Calcium-activated chloride channel regulator 2 n=1 Tax=Holothuria leucospilota TaxID=206669 RepID=A0A9Q1BRW9_HOLLE|nr:Calcium-activated chloride channel regulator 2 [Holothuria leucospilota]